MKAIFMQDKIEVESWWLARWCMAYLQDDWIIVFLGNWTFVHYLWTVGITASRSSGSTYRMNRCWGWTNLQLCCRHNLYCDYVDPFIIFLGEGQSSECGARQGTCNIIVIVQSHHLDANPTPSWDPALLCLAPVTVASYQPVANLSTEAFAADAFVIGG